MKYKLVYEGYTVRVDIKPSKKSKESIKAMVEFWGGWKGRLEDAGGDYVTCWLRQLLLECILRGVPVDREGWCPLDGTRGISVRAQSAWMPDEDLFEIERLS
jgi:hypothetical protein